MPPARQFRGAFTALVTPFTATGAIDQDAFRSLVRRPVSYTHLTLPTIYSV